MQLAYRTTRTGALDIDLNNASKDREVLIVSRADARKQIRVTEDRLQKRTPRHVRADLLNHRALLYQALGDPAMLRASEESYRFSRGAIPAFVLALSYHFHGRMAEAFEYYTKAYRLPHGSVADTEIAFGYVTQFLFRREWDKAWPVLRGNCKRIVSALRRQNGGVMAEWTPESDAKEVSLIQEGGYGDIVQYSRYLPYFRDRGIKVVVYMTPAFYKSGFVDLFRQQGFDAEFRSAREIPAFVPAIGFLDLNFVLGVTPDTIPTYPRPWRASSESLQKYASVRGPKPTIGLCWKAQGKENVFCSPGVYRSLTDDQSRRLVDATGEKFRWVNLQFGETPDWMTCVPFRSWDENAGLIANCDAVVSVDTATAHLAAAMNVPVFAPLSGMLEWKYGLSEQGNRCLWYPTMEVFRNEGFGFENAVDKLVQRLMCL